MAQEADAFRPDRGCLAQQCHLATDPDVEGVVAGGEDGFDRVLGFLTREVRLIRMQDAGRAPDSVGTAARSELSGWNPDKVPLHQHLPRMPRSRSQAGDTPRVRRHPGVALTTREARQLARQLRRLAVLAGVVR